MPPNVSFEFFTPKNVRAAFQLASCVDTLKGFGPDFMSVTCGTGGGSVNLTHETTTAISQQTDAPVFAHMTCGAQTAADIDFQAHRYAETGMSKVVALRGDAPASAATSSHESLYQTVADFVAALANQGLRSYVAAYPETHPKAASTIADLDVLKAKQDAGAIGAITQFFFEADTFLRFRDRCVAHGITMELMPGILPVTNWGAIKRMAAECGTHVPADLAEGFARAARENRAALMATAHAVELCDTLQSEGVDHFHIYTLNKSSACAAICAALGLPYQSALRQVA